MSANVSSEVPNFTGLTINVVPSSYANKLNPKSLTKANLQKTKANVPNGADYDIWLPLASVHEEKYGLEKVTLLKVFFFFKFASIEGVKSVLRNGPWMICGILIFSNKQSPSVSLLKEELSCIPIWVKFHDILLVAYTSDGLSLMAKKIGNPMMLDSYTNSMCLESWDRSSYARILIEINACNDFSDHLVMAIPNLKGNGYTKETIRIKYEWEPPHCSSCLIFGHSHADCPKSLKAAPIRVVNQKDKGRGQTSGADNEGFIKVKKKKSGGINGGTKFFVKPKTQYRPKAKQSTDGTSNSPKTTPLVGTNKASTLGYSSRNKGNIFSLSNSFEALNDDNMIIEEDED
ncbi:putative ribonuclease H-like domain-containing protein [Tanacetum coccineum]|uniref:Ribonuclease H-like domain-containing protein n=1 Tax=Tanacetum coccineum TaxID=301880 RepID=A0ABQ5I9W1_9ASTR